MLCVWIFTKVARRLKYTFKVAYVNKFVKQKKREAVWNQLNRPLVANIFYFFLNRKKNTRT